MELLLVQNISLAPAYAIASFLVIYIIDLEYAVSICLLVRLLMIIVFHIFHL